MNAKEKIVARIAEYDKRIAIRQNNSCYHDETEAVKSFNDRAHGLEQALVILAECEKDGNLVEVVRCEDCKFGQGTLNGCKTYRRCRATGSVVTINDYRSYGERREIKWQIVVNIL